MSNSHASLMVIKNFTPEGASIGSLLYSMDVYEVPPYQRDYSWKKIHLEDFWKDINNFSGDYHFFGSMLFQTVTEGENKKMYVIDGQQRFTTITVLLAVIRDFLLKENDVKDATLTQQKIIQDVSSDKKIRKITLNLRNRDFFYHCIQCYGDDIDYKDTETFIKEFGRKATNDLIEDAYKFFQEKINQDITNLTTKEKIAYLNKLSETIREKLAIISITVSNIRYAYIIFETINQRGIDLAVSDLFKNFTISKSTNREEMVRIWENIFNLLDDKVKSFLKHYWHSKKGVVQDRTLFREMTDYIENRDNGVDIEVLTKEIGKEATVYSALQNTESTYWGDEDAEVIDLLEDFQTLKLRQPLPLLTVGKLHFSDEEFKKLLRAVVNFELRYIICKLPHNVLERLYSDIAIRIRGAVVKDDVTSPKITDTEGVIEEFKKFEKFPDDTLFEQEFKKGKFENPLARFILKKIEIHKFNKANPRTESTEPLDYNKFTLEHIIPQRMDEEWEKYFKQKKIKIQDVQEWVYLIGNMSLLDKKKNGFSRNSFIAKKCAKAYNISLLKINEPLKSITDWSLSNIQSRANDFFKEALEIW